MAAASANAARNNSSVGAARRTCKFLREGH
jgi:hypothetical protein